MSEPETALVTQLLKTLMQFRKNNWHEKATIAGFKRSEIKVILAIKNGINNGKENMKISEISKMLRVTSPTVTQIVNDLEKANLVIRETDPSDRRAVKIRLTEAGDDVVLKAKEEFTKTLSGLIDYLGVEESKHLVELLSKTFNYLNQEIKDR